jgi:hypothetical protein
MPVTTTYSVIHVLYTVKCTLSARSVISSNYIGIPLG